MTTRSETTCDACAAVQPKPGSDPDGRYCETLGWITIYLNGGFRNGPELEVLQHACSVPCLRVLQAQLADSWEALLELRNGYSTGWQNPGDGADASS